MGKKDCSTCKVGALDRHHNVAGCPYYRPTRDHHCANWLPLHNDDTEHGIANDKRGNKDD